MDTLKKNILTTSLIFSLFLLFISACDEEKGLAKDIANVREKPQELVRVEKVLPSKKIYQNRDITVKFSSPMNPDSFSTLKVTLHDPLTNSDVEIELNVQDENLKILPIKTLRLNQNYTLLIDKNVKDMAGISLEKTYITSLYCVPHPLNH